MIELKKADFPVRESHSSKGNQFKWMKDGIWYKADYLGYESLAEIVVSKLLKKSNVPEYVSYEYEEIVWKNQVYRGCSSNSFLQEGEEIWTCERLFQKFYGGSLVKNMAGKEIGEKVRYLTTSIESITGIKNFGKYVTMLLELDAFFLNEDRHTHNIAVIRSGNGDFRLCPVFDNGAALFSDTVNDYLAGASLESFYEKIEAKPFDRDFDLQMDAAEEMYGQQLQLNFTQKDVEACLKTYEPYYEKSVTERIEEILRIQQRKYSYLFSFEETL
ncbi:MAG: hypothetical protein KH828_03380 [Clostridiales bacterium]|nr:hypothetical protein [Clostridiales bacterium]